MLGYHCAAVSASTPRPTKIIAASAAPSAVRLVACWACARFDAGYGTTQKSLSLHMRSLGHVCTPLEQLKTQYPITQSTKAVLPAGTWHGFDELSHGGRQPYFGLHVEFATRQSLGALHGP